MCTSFKVPKACNWVKKVENYYTPLLAHPLIDKHHYLLPKDVRFTAQDICLGQLQHTITYARPLQYWAKEVHPPVPSQPHCLARSVQELQWAMKPLISFEEEEVYVAMVPSNWTEVTSPWLMETVPQEYKKSHTWSNRAHLRGAMSVTQGKGWHATTAMQATATAEALATPAWEVRPHQPSSDSWPLCPPPRFAEITQTLRREEPMESSPPLVITGIPTQEVVDPYEAVGMVARLLQNQTPDTCAAESCWHACTCTGVPNLEMWVHIQVCSKGIMGMGLGPKVDRHPTLTLQELKFWQLNLLPHCLVFIQFLLCHPVLSSGIHAMMFLCHF